MVKVSVLLEGDVDDVADVSGVEGAGGWLTGTRALEGPGLADTAQV